MLTIAKSLISNMSQKKFYEFIAYFKSSFDGGDLNKIPSHSKGHVFNRKNLIVWDDTLISSDK